jgi:hypothetical protein
MSIWNKDEGASKWGEIYDSDSDISMGLCPENVSKWQFVTLAYLTHLQGKWRLVKIGGSTEL